MNGEHLRERVENLERRVLQLESAYRVGQRTWLDLGPATLGVVVVVGLLLLALIVFAAIAQN